MQLPESFSYFWKKPLEVKIKLVHSRLIRPN